MIAADRADVSLAPSISSARLQSQPIQGGGYLVIRELASHATDDLDRFQASTPAMLAGGILLDMQFRVLATGPVNQQNDLLVLLIYIGDDLAIRMRTMRCFKRMSVVGRFQTAARSCARLCNVSLSGIRAA